MKVDSGFSCLEQLEKVEVFSQGAENVSQVLGVVQNTYRSVPVLVIRCDVVAEQVEGTVTAKFRVFWQQKSRYCFRQWTEGVDHQNIQSITPFDLQ